MTTRTDIEKLIARVALKDRAAFSALYNATSAKLFGVCLRVLKNRAEAEDALQETFVRIWDKADYFAANGYSPMTWLITVARHIAIDKLRARNSASAAPDMMVDIDEHRDIRDNDPSPEDAALSAAERGRIETCLAELEQVRADAVRGAYLNGETYQHLADFHGVPLNTMRTWLRRSLMKLKECLSR